MDQIDLSGLVWDYKDYLHYGFYEFGIVTPDVENLGRKLSGGVFYYNCI